jgi:type VI protein secretion system component Hcp
VLAFVASASTIAVHADDYHLRLTGGSTSIVGEGTTEGYENWIDVDSVAWGVAADSSWTRGGGASIGKPNPGAISWIQGFDSSVPSMYSYMLKGLAVPNAVFEYTRQNGAGDTTYLQLNIEDLLFTELAFNGSSVAASGVFKKISMTYWPQDGSGGRDKPINVVWDIPAGTVGSNGALAAVVAGYGPGNLDGKGFALAALSAPNLAPVPEPETWAMVVSGLVLLGFALRRNRVPATRALS